ncbi:Hsp70 family protein [Nocardia sp. CA-129566]|uniref:Hsp70 family protein n=1 Tax=Nocardia sp. CA-129566 TaxID=3239976 RepID=UPI003D981E13
MNTVSAMMTGERPWSSVRTRRTAVTFDSAGGIRIGGIPQFTMAVTDFADLARDPESMIVGGRLWSPANLVAAVVNGLLESFPPTAGAVAAYPACYSDKQLSLLRQALNLAGAADVMLIPEPVAAAEWLEHERGPLESGFVLVYDLGGTSLDVSMVRVGPDWDDHPIVGKSVRSYDFGGRPLGSMIARYAQVAAPGDNGSMLQMTSIVDIGGLRTQHIRDSFDVIGECVDSTGRSLSDVDCILLVGGATRPVEVARTIAELGRPVVMSTDPGQTVAVGAAGYAARSFAPLVTGGRHRAPKVAVFSSAAVASAVAVSAVTVFGGPTVTEMPSLIDASPKGRHPMDNLLFEPHIEALTDAGSAVSRAVDWASNAVGFGYSGRPAYGIAPVGLVTTIGPSVAEAHGGSHQNPRSGSMQSGGGTYANPAQFLNPIPFVQPVPTQPGLPAAPMPIPRVSIPGSVPAPNNSIPAAPASPPTGGSATPGTAIPGTHVGDTPISGSPAPGLPPGETPSGTGTSGGTSAEGSWSGTASGDTSGSTWGGTSSGGTTSGTSTNGSTSGTSGSTSSDTSGDSTSGSTSDSSTSGTGGGIGGSTSGSNGGHSSGGSDSGGTSGSNGGHSSGGSDSGGTSGSNGGHSSGGSDSGGTSGSNGGHSSGGSDSGGTSGSNGGHSSGGSDSGGTSGSNGGHSSGGSNSGDTFGGSDGGHSVGGSNSGGTFGGSDGGHSLDGSNSGGTPGGSTSGGGMPGGSTGGRSPGNSSSGGRNPGGSLSGGSASGGFGGGGAHIGGGGAHIGGGAHR